MINNKVGGKKTTTSTSTSKKLYGGAKKLSSTKTFVKSNKYTITPTIRGKDGEIKPKPPTKPIRDKKVIFEENEDSITFVNKSDYVDGINPNQQATGVAFQRLGCSTTMIESLKEMKITVPSLVQQLAIPEILKNKKDVLFVSQTGTGKTLAYLAPIVQLLKERELEEQKQQQEQPQQQNQEEIIGEVDTEQQEENNSEKPKPNFQQRLPKRPRAIILVPTRELALQVDSVARELAHHLKFRTTVVSSGGTEINKFIKKFHKTPIDIVVATPGTLIQLIENKQLFFSKLQHLVIDEADSMFAVGKGFDDELNKIIEPIAFRLRNKQIPGYQSVNAVICSATLTNQLMKTINSIFPDYIKLATPTIHKSLNTLEQKFVHIKGGDKHQALFNALNESLPTTKNKTMVFCNSPNSCRSTEHTLNENGFKATSLHGEIPAKTRSRNWKLFKNDGANTNILVCTDIASRGIDLDMVSHVILFDFPSNPIDYLHRIGRTARAGKKGKVTSLITKKDQVLAHAIVLSLKRGESLEDLSANNKVNQDRQKEKRAIYKKIGKETKERVKKEKLKQKMNKNKK
eukprot:gene9125-11181_t